MGLFLYMKTYRLYGKVACYGEVHYFIQGSAALCA